MTTPFSRTRLTWLMYFLLALFAFLEALPGPMMPFLGDELGLSYTVRGFHFSAFAFGLMVAGLIGERVSRQFGRRNVLFFGGLGMNIGVVGLILAQHPAISIVSLLLIGSVGGLVFVMVQAILADYHGKQRAIALTEANIVASMGAGLTPVIIGVPESLDLSWRGALIIPIGIWVVLSWLGRSVDLPNAETLEPSENSSAPQTTKLPLLFWAYAGLLFLGVAVEWSVIYWGAEFLTEKTSLSKATAVNMMSFYFIAFVLGRIISSRLARRYPAENLLLAAFILTSLGFLPFWLSNNAVISVIGLFVAGSAIATLFPLALALATGVVGNSQTDAASSRISLMVGLAIFLAPQILGSLADQIGLTGAYGIVAVLLLIALMAEGIVMRYTHNQSERQPAN